MFPALAREWSRRRRGPGSRSASGRRWSGTPRAPPGSRRPRAGVDPAPRCWFQGIKGEWSRAGPFDEDEVEGGVEVSGFRFLDVGGVHRLDQVRPTQVEQAGVVRLNQACLEAGQ